MVITIEEGGCCNANNQAIISSPIDLSNSNHRQKYAHSCMLLHVCMCMSKGEVVNCAFMSLYPHRFQGHDHDSSVTLKQRITL